MAKLVVCIPTLTGQISAWTMASLWGLAPQNYQPRLLEYLKKASELLPDIVPDIHLQKALALAEKPFGIEIADAWLWPYDLARVRSRAVRKFLHETDATHLLFIDADVSFEPLVVSKMIAVGQEVVSVPYPKRDVRWDLAYEAARSGKHPEHGAYEYVFRALSEEVSSDGLVRVAGVGMGCTLISRWCLELMWSEFVGGDKHEDLRAWDNHPVDGGETVMLFAMQWGEMNGKRHLFGEDLSFCNRWRELGGTCWMYVGEGSPASHHGHHYFRGTAEGFALDAARGEKGRETK